MSDEQDVQNETSTTLGSEEIKNLPEWAQRVIRELRDENKSRRIKESEFEKSQREQQEAQLAEQNRWKELAEARQKERDQLSPYKTQVEQMSETLKSVLDSQLESLPEEARTMVSDMPGTVQEKLDWLAKNRARLTRPAAPEMDAGARGDNSPNKNVKLTPEQEQALASAQRVDPKMTRERYIARLLQMQGGG
jgi:predicted phage tail protein